MSKPVSLRYRARSPGMMRWMAFAVFVFMLNFVWEMVQARWFASMRGLTLWRATLICTWATLGDVLIATIAFAVAAVVAKSVTWPVQRGAILAMIAFVLVGIAISISYEVLALRSGRWRYDPTMPVLFGIGLPPLLQWILLPTCEVLVFRALCRRS